jgi:hypothetical protein
VRGWYPEGIRSTPLYSVPVTPDAGTRLTPGVHYRDVKVQPALAPPVSRIKPFAPTVLAFIVFSLALLAFTIAIAR